LPKSQKIAAFYNEVIQKEKTMSIILRLFAALMLVVAVLASPDAKAQNTPTITYVGFTYVDVDVVRFVTRPPDATGVYPYYAVLSGGFAGTGPNGIPCLNPASATNNTWAVMYSNQPDFKLMRETLQLAFALNKRVRVFANGCANLVPGTNDYVYPKIWGVETL
jgi:hypothetical protein